MYTGGDAAAAVANRTDYLVQKCLAGPGQYKNVYNHRPLLVNRFQSDISCLI